MLSDVLSLQTTGEYGILALTLSAIYAEDI
jgi:hypothetical protein